MDKQIVFIGDVHGCIIEFEELLKLIGEKCNNPRIICLGDFLDRGPDSVAVVKLAREMKLECIMGNHEHKFVKWFRSQGTKVDVYDRKDHYTKFSDADISYIMNMPSHIELEDVIAVHAGLKPGIPLSNQKSDMMHLRYTDSDRKFISLKKIATLGIKETGAKFWTGFGPFIKNVVYGHNVNSITEIRIDQFDNGTACYGIDTGVCFGGRLTALIWETKEIVQVQAKKVYYQSDFTIKE